MVQIARTRTAATTKAPARTAAIAPAPTKADAPATAPRRHATCTHHWVIEDPVGPESHGRCRGCGEERVFQNAPARPSFDRSSTVMGRYRSSVRWSVREEIRLSDE
jgi:hypothetical protein